jgi:hypothetical protein
MGSKLRAIVMKGFEVVPVEATGASDGVETKAQPTDTVPGLDAPAKPVQRSAAEDAIKRDTEMELANQEIDALIAKRQAPESEGLPVVPDQRAPVTATVVHDPAPQTTAPAWTLKQTPERLPGYRWPLYCFLLVAHDAGKSRPKPVEVLSAWREKLPPEIARVSAASIDYYDADGNEQTASLEAIRKTIGRMTGR